MIYLKKIKQIHHCNIIPSYFPKWVFLEQTETVFSEMKTISQWKWHSGRNGIVPIAQKCTENPELETLSKFRQHRFQILINRKRFLIKDLIPCSGTQDTPKRPNTLSNRFTQIDHRSIHRCLSRG